MKLIEILKKQGGMRLLKQYWQGGALFTGIGEFLLLGKKQNRSRNIASINHLENKTKIGKDIVGTIDILKINKTTI